MFYLREVAYKMKRDFINKLEIEKELNNIKNYLYEILEKKGYGAYASPHEILGSITEEYLELCYAIKVDDKNNTRDELIDIAVVCIFGCVCLKKIK